MPAGGVLAFDIGTGSGILAAVLARRGVQHVVATDQAPRALACAQKNIENLGLTANVEILNADMFPQGRAPLVVCNPPWVPAQPSSPIEFAVYDPDSQMLRAFLGGLAEHLGLRSRGELMAMLESSGLKVVERIDTRPRHPKVQDSADPLHAARASEVTSLWRLATVVA